MNTSGSGVTYLKTSHSDELKLFNGGLRAVPFGQKNLEMNRNFIDDQHDMLDYQRGVVIHSRSPTARMLDYHGLYGGSFKFWIQRYFYQNIYKRILRPVWIPCSALFICLLKSPVYWNEDV